jgi:hypothetical protein
MLDDPYNMYFTPDGRDAIVMAEAHTRLDFRDAQTMALKSSLSCPYRRAREERGGALGETIRVTDHDTDHQLRAVLHEDVPVVAQDGRALVARLEQSRLRISGRLVCRIATLLAISVSVGVTATAGRRTIARAVLAAEALVNGPRLHPPRMISQQQAPLVRQAHDFGEESFHDFMLQQPVAVLREHRVVPHGVLNRRPDEPIA